MKKSISNKGIKEILESHFKDVCDIEFTIQEGRLWLLNARSAKRNGRANLKISIDLFLEKKIEYFEVIERISLQDIYDYCQPTINNEEDLLVLGRGLPAGPSVATGRIYFSSEKVCKLTRQECIICKEEYNPEDIEGMRCAKGILSSRGGMTSHAA